MRNLIFGFFVVVFSLGFVGASTASFYFDINGNNSEVVFGEVMRSSGVVFQVNTDRSAVCKYSIYEGVSFANMEGTFDFSFETVHKKDLVGLTDGVYRYYVRCHDGMGNNSGELEATFAVSLPVSAQVTVSGGEIIGAGRTEISVKTSKALSQTPSLSYSFNGFDYDPVPLFGSGKEWKGYLTISDSNEELTGSFKFQGRDLEGVLGSEITGGGTFFVDTKKPKAISDIKAVGYEGEVEISWEFEEDDEIEEYRIYRSSEQGVDYSDFLKSVEEDSYTDTDVDRGKTYYYRVAGVDKAGNIADLSKEVYATALLSDTNTQTGLELRYVGLVDNFLSEIDNFVNMAEDVKDDFERESGRGGELYDLLKLERDINGAKSELDALKREVENYKSQSLSKSELDQKLNSGRLKLNTIKRKIPESIVVVSEKSEKQSVGEDVIASVVLRIWPDISEGLKNKRMTASSKLMEENGFDVNTEGYNLEIVFMDGTRRELALIREKINFDHNNNDSVYILEIVPEGIASNVNDLSIKNVDYDVVKEDTIVSFSADTDEILYTLDNHMDLDALRGIQTLAMFEVQEETKENVSLSGYFSFIDLENGGNYVGVIFAVLVITGLGGYLVYMRRISQTSEKLIPLRQIIDDAENSLKQGRGDMARDFYHAASLHYKGLEKNLQKLVYGELESLHKKILSVK